MTVSEFHMLAKPTGSACNLACEYCFFLRKSELYPGQRQRMSDETLDAYLSQLLDAHPDGPVNIAFQGGEPTLMGVDFYRRAVELVEEHRRPGQEPVYSIQTNATLIDAEWASFLAENRFLVGVSIDGPADVHDAFRHTNSGEPTHESVVKGIRALNEAGTEWNALVTVNRASEGRGADVYRFLRDQAGARFIQFIPIVERETDATGTPTGSAVTERSVTAQVYGAFLADVFDVWVRADVASVFVQDFDAALAAWAGEGNPICVHAPVCGRALALEFNGDAYSCDHFVDGEHLLGNLHDTPLATLTESETQRLFGADKEMSMPAECETCEVKFACHGGCPKDRFVPSQDGQPPSNYLCEGYRRFYRYVDEPMRVMAALLAQDLPPSDVMQLVAEVDAERDAALASAGRNEPCPCGSGHKYKHCHGAAR